MFLWIVFIMQRAITHFRIISGGTFTSVNLPTARRSKTVSLKHSFSKLINIMLDKINGSELKHELEKWFFRDAIFFPRWWWVGRQVLLKLWCQTCLPRSWPLLLHAQSQERNTTIGEPCDCGPPREQITYKWNSKDRNAPIRAAENQLITTKHHAYKIMHDQSTSSPEEE